MDYNPPGSSVRGFSQQEYWSGWPFSPPGDLLDPGIGPESLTSSESLGSPALARGFFTTGATWEAPWEAPWETLV